MRRPSFTLEIKHWQQGYQCVAGIDEAGLGALAGPVVAAAVIWPPHFPADIPVQDSKQLTPARREEYTTLIQHFSDWGIGVATVEEIDQLNIRRASHVAMERAISQLTSAPEVILVDGNPLQLAVTGQVTNVVKGDQISYSIAAASILAKVHRDAIMGQLDKKLPVYRFAAHKGYGTKAHIHALNVHGPSPYHRRSYAPVAKASLTFSL